MLGYTRAAVAIGEARAAAILAAAQAGLPVTLYKPSEVKQFVTSYGRGSKEQVGLMVQALLAPQRAAIPAGRRRRSRRRVCATPSSAALGDAAANPSSFPLPHSRRRAGAVPP